MKLDEISKNSILNVDYELGADLERKTIGQLEDAIFVSALIAQEPVPLNAIEREKAR